MAWVRAQRGLGVEPQRRQALGDRVRPGVDRSTRAGGGTPATGLAGDAAHPAVVERSTRAGGGTPATAGLGPDRRRWRWPLNEGWGWNPSDGCRGRSCTSSDAPLNEGWGWNPSDGPHSAFTVTGPRPTAQRGLGVEPQRREPHHDRPRRKGRNAQRGLGVEPQRRTTVGPQYGYPAVGAQRGLGVEPQRRHATHPIQRRSFQNAQRGLGVEPQRRERGPGR